MDGPPSVLMRPLAEDFYSKSWQVTIYLTAAAFYDNPFIAYDCSER